jgi:hypothetical protein
MLCSNQDKKQIIAQFDGGEITSDGGLLLLREAALGMDLFHRLARCFWDCRDRRYLQYPLDEMLAQRVSALALGYEDLNDHDSLCHDPALRLMAAQVKKTSSPRR